MLVDIPQEAGGPKETRVFFFLRGDGKVQVFALLFPPWEIQI